VALRASFRSHQSPITRRASATFAAPFLSVSQASSPRSACFSSQTLVPTTTNPLPQSPTLEFLRVKPATPIGDQGHQVVSRPNMTSSDQDHGLLADQPQFRVQDPLHRKMESDASPRHITLPPTQRPISCFEASNPFDQAIRSTASPASPPFPVPA
jgi:hypothetical protein